MPSPTKGLPIPASPPMAPGTPVGSSPRKPAAVCPRPAASCDRAEGAAAVSQHRECHLVLGATRLQGHLHLHSMRVGVRVRMEVGVALGVEVGVGGVKGEGGGEDEGRERVEVGLEGEDRSGGRSGSGS